MRLDDINRSNFKIKYSWCRGNEKDLEDAVELVGGVVVEEKRQPGSYLPHRVPISRR